MEAIKESTKVSKYIIPIYSYKKETLYNYVNSENKMWNTVSEINNPRYISSCVKAHFCGTEETDISEYYLTSKGYSDLKVPYRGQQLEMKSKTKRGKDNSKIDEIFLFKIRKTGLWLFATGIAFIVIEVEYPSEYGIDTIADFSYSFSRILQKNHSDDIEFFLSEDKTKIEISSLILHFIEVTESELLTNDDVIQSFHVVSSKVEKLENVEWRKYAYAISRGLASNAMINESDVANNSIDYSYANGINWIADSFGTVCFSEYVESDDYDFVPQFARNALFNYFFFYLLALHSREFLVKVNTEIIESYDEKDVVIKLQEKVMIFDAVFSHKNVSKYSPYQVFYEKLMDLFDTENLRMDVKAALAQIDSFDKQKSERRTKRFRTLISAFGIVSIYNNSISLVNSISSDFSSIQMIMLIVETVLIVWCCSFAFKKRKK